MWIHNMDFSLQFVKYNCKLEYLIAVCLKTFNFRQSQRFDANKKQDERPKAKNS